MWICQSFGLLESVCTVSCNSDWQFYCTALLLPGISESSKSFLTHLGTCDETNPLHRGVSRLPGTLSSHSLNGRRFYFTCPCAIWARFNDAITDDGTTQGRREGEVTRLSKKNKKTG